MTTTREPHWISGGPESTTAHTATPIHDGRIRTGCGRILDGATPPAGPNTRRCRLCERIHHGDPHTNRPIILGRRRPG